MERLPAHGIEPSTIDGQVMTTMGGETAWADPPAAGSTTGSSGELLMQDGVTGPPVPLETEARDDWLYQG